MADHALVANDGVNRRVGATESVHPRSGSFRRRSQCARDEGGELSPIPDTRSKAAKSGARSPALHEADSHELIRVQGARVNNLKDVSVEIPKRRLTVFTGISGSGKSSLVFDTIAAESQRLINETYSAFVQGFMPTLTRPEVDVLDGLTTAIIVDQERMGANPAPPSEPPPTPTRCCASSSAGSGGRTSVRRTPTRSTSPR
jgi:ABC-type glutathione transport system ATPase component